MRSCNLITLLVCAASLSSVVAAPVPTSADVETSLLEARAPKKAKKPKSKTSPAKSSSFSGQATYFYQAGGQGTFSSTRVEFC